MQFLRDLPVTKTNDDRFTLDPYEKTQAVAKLNIPFLGHDCEIWVRLGEDLDLEAAPREPNISQRQLNVLKSILELEETAFKSEMDRAAQDYHRVADGDSSIAVDDDNVAENYKPYMFIIPFLEETDEDYFVINCSCTWDVEHAMSMGVKNMSIVYCGENTGMTTWQEIEEELGVQE